MSTETSATPLPGDVRRTKIFQLAEWLRDGGRPWEIKRDINDPRMTITLPDETEVTVSCRNRGSDGGRLWFYFGIGEPIVEADNVADAAIAVRDRVRQLVEAKT